MISRIRARLESEDPSTARELLHTLKGTSATISAVRVSAAASAVEASSRSGRGWQDDIAELEFTPVLARLQSLIESSLPAFEADIEAAGAPWTPGRTLPDWPPE